MGPTQLHIQPTTNHQPPTNQQTNMPANRASKGPREASRNSRSKASGNNTSTGGRAAPNRRQMRRMQANGLSARKPRRPEAEEAGGKGHGAAEQGDALSAGAD